MKKIIFLILLLFMFGCRDKEKNTQRKTGVSQNISIGSKNFNYFDFVEQHGISTFGQNSFGILEIDLKSNAPGTIKSIAVEGNGLKNDLVYDPLKNRYLTVLKNLSNNPEITIKIFSQGKSYIEKISPLSWKDYSNGGSGSKHLITGDRMYPLSDNMSKNYVNDMIKNIESNKNFYISDAEYGKTIGIKNMTVLDSYKEQWNILEDESDKLGNVYLVDNNLNISSNPNHTYPGSIKDVSVGANFFVILKSNGELWGAGRNNHGQLGNGTFNDVQDLVKIADGVDKVATGQSHLVYLKKDKSLWSTGYNTLGQLGIGTNTNVNTPVEIAKNVDDVSASNYNTYYLQNNDFYAVGDGTWGQLGNGRGGLNYHERTPVLIKRDVESIIGAGGAHVIIMNTAGEILGTGNKSPLGLGNSGGSNATNNFEKLRIPMNQKIERIYVGGSFTLYLDSASELFGMGQTGYGQMGDGSTTTPNHHFPTQISLLGLNSNEIESIFTGVNSTFFLKNDSSVYSTGNGFNGNLGNGSNIGRVGTPTKVLEGVKKIASYQKMTIALKKDGTLWTTGDFQYSNISTTNTFTLLNW